jgi:hypothetical protein
MSMSTENVIAWGLDDPEVLKPMSEPMEIDSQFVDDSAFSNPLKGMRIAIAISLSLWAGIILALVQLFSALK